MKRFCDLRRYHFPLMLVFSLCAPALFAIHRIAPGMPFLLWLFPVASALVCVLCAAVPGRFRVLCAALGTGAFALALSLHAPVRSAPCLLALAPCAGALALFSIPLAARDEHSISPVFYVSGLLLHLFFQLLLHFDLQSGSTEAPLPSAPLTAVFAVYLLLLLLALNRITLDNATLSRYRLPASMRRINTLLVLGFAALSLLVSLLPAVARGLVFALRLLRDGIVQFTLWLMRLFPSSGTVGGMGMGGVMPFPMGVPEEQAPSSFFIAFERIVTVLAAAVIVFGLFLLLRILVVQLRRLLRFLTSRLRLLASAVSEDYVDEITDTREESGRENRILLRIRRHARRDDPPQTPAQRIRRRYARLLDRHPRWSDSSTARENLPRLPASIYERARYSTDAVSQDDAERFLRETR